jgi:hypothetical protein
MRLLALVCTGLLVANCVASAALADELDPGITEPPAASVPPDLYVVTDVYAGGVVTTTGDTTTYTTATVHDSPGTYARVIDVVGTGVPSAFDARSFNGRARLADGRLVSGVYYENFVLTSVGFVSVNIVFFQDDSETASRPSSTPAPTASTRPPAPTAAPGPTGSLPTPTAGPAASPSPTAIPMPSAPRPVIVTAGVALAASGPALGAIDVLRGRVVQLWPRAFVDGIPVPVREWRLVDGIVDEASRRSGGAFDPCDATWLAPASPNTSRVLRFEVTTDAAPGRVLTATIAVTVRSPALLQ